MRHFKGSRADTTLGTYTVHEAYAQGVSMHVAVPYPYCRDLTQVQEMCAGVLGMPCQQERLFAPSAATCREALANTKEIYAGLFPRTGRRA